MVKCYVLPSFLCYTLSMESIVNLMKKFGFTEYETKVYTTLLQIGQATGYEISKMSNVPRSKVYNTLETLYQKGFVQRSSGEQVLYCAVSVKDLIRTLKQTTTNDLVDLEQELIRQEENVVEQNEIWNIVGYENVLSKVKNAVMTAEKELFLQIWVEDIDDELLLLLQEAEKRIDKFALILFSEEQHYNIGLTRAYSHFFEHEKLMEMNARWMNLVQDQLMLLGTIHSKTDASAVTTQYSPMIFLAKEFVKHDAYTARLFEMMPDDVRDSYRNKVRKIYK